MISSKMGSSDDSEITANKEISLFVPAPIDQSNYEDEASAEAA
jgi:hypothetical protein